MKVHRKRSFYQTISCLAAAMMLSSCTGERSFLQIQFCVVNSQGVELFKSTLQDIAKNERMNYIDGSENTTRDLKVLKTTGKNIHTDGRLINVGVEANNYGLSGGNLGLNPYDISLGFAPDTPESRAFSQRVVARLKHHWTLKQVPSNSGAFPDPDCAQGTETPPN
jgi:hypothetical protein